MGYVEDHGVTVTADLLIAYDDATRTHSHASDEERIRLGLDAMRRALERYRKETMGEHRGAMLTHC